MTNPIGRPMKYRKFLEILEDNTVYTAASIIRNGEDAGLFAGALSTASLKQQRLRARHALARFSDNHQFPKEGDGYVHLPGQAPMRGWYGRRWKDALPELG